MTSTEGYGLYQTLASMVQSSDYMTLNLLQVYIIKYINFLIVVLKSTMICVIIIMT